MSPFSSTFAILAVSLSLSISMNGGVATKAQRNAQAEKNPVRAKYLITTADDFIVDAYLNGKAIPQAKRELLVERFGATVEKINVEVRKGDWLVFNVVNNKMRWNANYYFAVAGCFAENEFGFVSQNTSDEWCVCDTPHDVDRFISDRKFFRHRPAQEVRIPWADGDPLMKQFAGSQWKGQAVWGASRNTWVKMIVD